MPELVQRVSTRDVIAFTVPPKAQAFIRQMAEKAQVGGTSHVRDPQSRTQAMGEDQLVGQLGQFALSVYLTGDTKEYVRAREKANANPTSGDGGADILDSNIDIKTSRMRAGEDPVGYTLPVRPAERHPNWIYILALVPKKRDDLVYLVGWLRDEDLPTVTDRSGEFRGCYTRRARELSPLPPFRWPRGQMVNLEGPRQEVQPVEDPIASAQDIFDA
jgi:hypothetical protein